MKRVVISALLMASPAVAGEPVEAPAGAAAVKPGGTATAGKPIDQATLCETVWPATAPGKAAAKDTWACMTWYLTLAYGKKPDAEAMSLDPGYGMPQEVRLANARLDNMVAHVSAVCDRSAAPVESECNRAAELFEGIKRRRLALLDDTVMESFEPVLATVLKGEKLSRAELKADDEVKWSPLTLWKLRNAAYARHGFKFKTPDLNVFFYGPREESSVLPLARGEKAKVELTAIDGENVRLIKSLESAKKK